MKKFFSVALVLIILVSMLAVPAFAYNFGVQELSDTVILKDGTSHKMQDVDGYWYLISGILYFSESPYYVKYDDTNNGERIYTGNSVTYIYNYQSTELDDGSVYARWVYSRDYNFTNANFEILDNVNWNSDDIYYSDGTLWRSGDPNFIIPLSETMIQLAGGELQTVAVPEMTTTMRILALSGVGLMALLMVFPLLKKVFSRFLH